MEYCPIGNDCDGELPMVGLGTCKSSGEVVRDTIRNAVKAGYRHFDCAEVYGNEKDIGQAFREVLAMGSVKRRDLFVASKLGVSFLHPDNVLTAFERTLNNLALEYLDLYYVHWPFALKYDGPTNYFPSDEAGNRIFDESVDYIDTWRKMEDLCLQGRVKAIGVSNFNIKQLKRLIENCRIPPTVHQFECHPYLNQVELVEFCKSQNIIPVAYSPLCPKDRNLPTEINLFSDPVLKRVAEKYGRTVAQVVLRYQIQRGIAVIPRSTNFSRINENINIFDFSISPEDFAMIDSLNKNFRILKAEKYAAHRYFPF